MKNDDLIIKKNHNVKNYTLEFYSFKFINVSNNSSGSAETWLGIQVLVDLRWSLDVYVGLDQLLWCHQSHSTSMHCHSPSLCAILLFILDYTAVHVPVTGIDSSQSKLKYNLLGYKISLP